MPLDLLDAELRKNPYPAYARAQREEPVHQDALGFWYVLRHADVTALQKDQRLGRDLRKWPGYQLVRPYLADTPLERCVEQWMFSLDPPDHTRLRRLVARAFTPKSVAAMRPFIEQAADELLGAIPSDATELELMTAFAQPFPVRVIAYVLGLAIEDYETIKAWSDALAVVVEPTARRKQKIAANEAVIQLMGYLRGQIVRRRTSEREDLLAELLRAEEDAQKLSEEELISQLVLMFLAGHETTANLIGNGTLALCRHPEELARLRDDPSLLPSAIEEMLRYDGPANTNGRVTHTDLEVSGVTIPRGAVLLCMLGAANRDPEVFTEPDRFDVARSPNPHVTFGGGIHHCLGSQLARLEAQVAFERLLKRFPRFTAIEARVAWRDLVNMRGLSQLPLSLG